MRRSLLIAVSGMVVLGLSVFAAVTRAAPPGQSLTVAPTSWSPSAPVGATESNEFTFTFGGKGNTGPLEVGVNSPGAAVSPFTFAAADDHCTGVTLSAKKTTCTVKVNFTPTSVTTSNATLTVSGRKLSASATLAGAGQAAALPGLSINSPLGYYNAGTRIVTFTVTMDKTSGTNVTFDWLAEDDTAFFGNTCDGSADYTRATNSGIGTIPAATTTTTIAFGTCDPAPGYHYPWDPTYFTVTISNPVGATITTATGTGTIRTS